jgi:hypothetical protein
MKKLTSKATFSHKQLFPLIWFGFLGVFLCACASIMADSTRERNEIPSESVQYVEMKQNGKEGEGIRLSDSQAQELTKRWNQARPIGLCKFYPTYIITVYDRNGGMRTFRATDDTMKEDDDYCFVLEGGYIEKILESNQ